MQAFQPRPIRHPLFRNLSSADAVARLEAGDDGDCVFRPSTRGVHMLNLTIRLAADIYVHIDIGEGPKVGPPNPPRLCFPLLRAVTRGLFLL